MVETLILAEPFRAVFYAPYYLAEAQGRLAAEGLAPRFEMAGTTALAASAVLEGRADLAWSGPMRVMQHRAADPASPLRAFCAVVMRDPFLIIGRAPRPGFALADLAGRSLGLVAEVPTPVWCLDDALGQVAPRRVTGRGMAENFAAVMAGEIDAAQLFEPYGAAAEEQGGAVWYAQAASGPMAYSSLYATETTLSDRRPAIRGVVRALAATLAWLRGADPGEAASLLAGHFPELPPPRLARAIARYQSLGLWADGPGFPRPAYDALGRAMRRAGVLPEVPDFDLCIDRALVDEALAG
jgi:NitT/TauT family transport system substrate-binding protein